MSETTHDLETAMRASLLAIQTGWPAMLTPTSSGGTGGGAQSARITADDHADTEADIDRATRIVSLRRFAVDTLNGWSRVVCEDRLNLHDDPHQVIPYRIPYGSDVPGMATFLDRHAQWMSGHEAAQDCADELADIARRIDALVTPRRREWMNLGSCPLKGEDGTPCGGRVRAWPRAEDRDGETMARCRTCGTEAVATWWESQMFDDAELKVWLTDADLVTFVHTTFGKVVTEATIRQWVKRKVLEASGSDDKGRRLFHREAVVFALDLHEKRARTRAR